MQRTRGHVPCFFTPSTPSDVSLVTHGSGTTVDATGHRHCDLPDPCWSMRGGAQGAAVLAGAHLKAAHMHMTGVAVTGVEVVGQGSSLELSFTCKFEKFSSELAAAVNTTAVLVRCEGAASLRSVDQLACMYECTHARVPL